MQARQREYLFDNAKFILIFLVVLAHGISDVRNIHPLVTTAWTFINIFHMPAFLFIAGYFSKSAVKDGRVDLQKPFTYTLYYLIGQVGAILFDHYVTHYPYTYNSLLYSASSLWFLQILIIYFILLPFLARLKRYVVIIIAIAGGLLIGFDDSVGHFLSVHRAFVFLPFFIAGYYFTPQLLEKLKKTKAYVRIIAAVAMIAVFALIYFKILKIPTRIITGQFSYLNMEDSYGTVWYMLWIWRVVFYIVSAILIAAFLLLMPRKKTFFSVFGGRTISVYILHRYLYLASSEFGWVSHNVNDKWTFLVLILIIIAITFILSLKPFYFPFKAVGSIKLDRFLKKE